MDEQQWFFYQRKGEVDGNGYYRTVEMTQAEMDEAGVWEYGPFESEEAARKYIEQG